MTGNGSMASGNSHVGNNSEKVHTQTQSYNQLDKSNGDDLLQFIPPLIAVGAMIAGDIKVANAPSLEDNLDTVPQSVSLLPTDLVAEAVNELTEHKYEMAIGIAAAVGNPKRALEDGADVAKAVSGKLGKKGSGDAQDATSPLSEGSCSGVYCNGVRVSDTGQKADVELNYSRNQPHHDPKEFVEQAFDQGAGLSERKAGEALNTLESYAKNGRPNEAQLAIRNYRDANPDVNIKGKDVLHKTDICVGGSPSCISKAGDSGVNRSIGAQNSRQTKVIKEQLDKIDSDTMPTVRVNIENKVGK